MIRLFLVLVLCGFVTPVDGQSSSPRSLSIPSAAAIEQLQAGTEAMRAGRVKEAADDFQQLTASAPRFPEAYLNLGLALSQLGSDEDAVRSLEKGISLKPSMRGAHLFLAIAQYRLNRLEPANTAIHAETSRFPDDAQAWMWQGIIELGLGRNAEAVEALGKAALLAPNSVDILYHRGRAALELSRQSYEQMFKQDPKSWHVHQVLAEADVESGRDADAVGEYREAIAAAPAQSGLYEALGSSLWRLGKQDEAQAAYEQGLKIDPGDVLTLYKLGCLRVDQSDAVGGKPLLDRVLAADPSLKLTRYYLGRAEFQLGDNDAAIRSFEEMLANNADDDTRKQVYFQLSRVYRRMRDVAASEQAQEQYRILDQRGKDALQEKLKQRQLRGDRDVNLPVAVQDDTAGRP